MWLGCLTRLGTGVGREPGIIPEPQIILQIQKPPGHQLAELSPSSVCVLRPRLISPDFPGAGKPILQINRPSDLYGRVSDLAQKGSIHRSSFAGRATISWRQASKLLGSSLPIFLLD